MSSETVEGFRALKKHLKDERQVNRERAREVLERVGLKFQAFNDDSLFIIQHPRWGRIMLWPSNEKVKTRKDKHIRDVSLDEVLGHLEVL